MKARSLTNSHRSTMFNTSSIHFLSYWFTH